MAHSNRRSHEYNTQVNGNSDLNYSSLHPSSQQCSVYSTQQDMPTIHHHIRTSSQDQGDNDVENKPALPPKPLHGPPIYREPPCPPASEDRNHHPDICINSSSVHPKIVEPTTYIHTAHHGDRPERLGSRTHAWVQEHKTSGKLVGEKLSSLQRKLRSFLSQSTSSKDCSEFEKPNIIEETSNMEVTQRSQALEITRPSISSNSDIPPYIPPSTYDGNSVAVHFPQSSSHNHNYKSSQHDKHPFAASSATSDHEDSIDPNHLRDTCSRFFARDQNISWTNYLSSRNCYSNNIKSSYDHDKLVPKEVIGKPSQERKSDITSQCVAIYGDVTPLPSFNNNLEDPLSQTEASSQTKDSSLLIRKSLKDKNKNNPSEATSCEIKVPNTVSEPTTSNHLTSGISVDCADVTDIYKSSSESGRGTMHSSRHGSKCVVSPHSSGISAASNLDTSLDSDQSGNGVIWNQQKENCVDKNYSEDFPINQVRHIYETPNSSKCKKSSKNDDVTSESFSITPPLPPLSAPPSPPMSAENSPKLSTRAKYKLSQSASALNSYSKGSDHQQRIFDSAPKSSSKKPNVRRTSSISQAPCRNRNGKSQFSKSSSSMGHGLGFSHIHCQSRKCNSSSPSRHLSRNQLTYSSCYMDNADPELTSTTTGLDMESLLDEDDYSSDVSASASTMEPSEVSMIRKQLEGLETMYSEILHLIGNKNSKNSSYGNPMEMSKHSRRKLNSSLSSLTAHGSTARSTNNFMDKRSYSEKRHSTKDLRSSSAGKRLQRLESHVVTLARSVAHLSSEMRTQHVLVQELENMRQDVSWVQERLRLMQLAQGCHSSNNGGRNHQMAMPRDWDNFHKEVSELLNPCRAKKLTKFFGDEPPLIRQFLKRLGYEKYAINFENEKVGIKELPYLTDERLQKMGLPMGPRIRILKEAHACGIQNQYKVYIV